MVLRPITLGYKSFPDPITRTCWDNYITISPRTAKKLNLKNWNVSNGALNGDLVDLTAKNINLKSLPILIQPGQMEDTIGVAVGYGRTSSGKSQII